jgi:uncharacterized protein (DUF885 family)
LNKTLLAEHVRAQIEDIDLKSYEMPITQFSGIHIGLPQVPLLVPLHTAKQYEEYILRLHQIPRALDQVIALLRQGEKDRLLPPGYLLEKTVVQCEDIASPAGETGAFALPLQGFPAGLAAADRKHLREAVIAAVDNEVRPAYSKLAQFLKAEYAPSGRHEAGIWSLPNGDARYRAAIRGQTTTEMDPERIYQLGLTKLREIENNIHQIAQSQGLDGWKSYDAAVKANPNMAAHSREQILEAYRGYIAEMEPKLPQLFGILPKTKLTVSALQEFREKGNAPARYADGTPDGSRPGRVEVNTGDFTHKLLPLAETIAYHEGIPGHHMQISIQQNLQGLPSFRQHADYNAYTEGWGLYAESICGELGLCQKPENHFENIASQQFRAARLVVDTGIHYKHWTRDQAVAFLREHSTFSDSEVVVPAQALSYMIGALKFIELRRRAQDRLGAKFDIRAFHDEMLSAGALPLDVLDARTNAWIADVKAGKRAAIAPCQ